MIIRIDKNKAPLIFKNNGEQVKGIKSFKYEYETKKLEPGSGTNSMMLDCYKETDNGGLILHHKGWEKIY